MSSRERDKRAKRQFEQWTRQHQENKNAADENKNVANEKKPPWRKEVQQS